MNETLRFASIFVQVSFSKHKFSSGVRLLAVTNGSASKIVWDNDELSYIVDEFAVGEIELRLQQGTSSVQDLLVWHFCIDLGNPLSNNRRE